MPMCMARVHSKGSVRLVCRCCSSLPSSVQLRHGVSQAALLLLLQWLLLLLLKVVSWGLPPVTWLVRCLLLLMELLVLLVLG